MADPKAPNKTTIGAITPKTVRKDVQASSYRLRDPERGEIGPIGLSTLRDLVDAGVVHADVLISRDDGEFRPMTWFAEIAMQPAAVQEPRATFAGDIGKNTFFKVFFRFHMTQATGLLTFRDGDKKKEIYMEQGQPVFVGSNIAKERLGVFLLDRNKIDAHDLNVAIDAQKTNDNSLGTTLLRLGLLEKDELYHELREQLLSRLVDLCMWIQGRYLFFDGIRHHGERIDLQLQAEELVVRAARNMTEDMFLRHLLPFFHKVPQLVSKHFKNFDFSPLEAQVLTNIDGKKTAAEVLTPYSADANSRRSALMVLYLLWEVDALRFS